MPRLLWFLAGWLSMLSGWGAIPRVLVIGEPTLFPDLSELTGLMAGKAAVKYVPCKLAAQASASATDIVYVSSEYCPGTGELLTRLKRTGARVVWAPILPGPDSRDLSSTRRLAREEGFQIDELYGSGGTNLARQAAGFLRGIIHSEEHPREYFRLRSDLHNSFTRFSAGGVARVVFLGGSITNMTGWRDLVCKDLQERFPQTSFDCVNAGIPSTGSTPAAFRLLRDVFARGPVDLLFEEAAVNDETNGFSSQQQLRGMEGIVRHALHVNPNIDIVLLHFVDPEKIEVIRRGAMPSVISTHEKVAGRYLLPSIDLAREIVDRIDAGEFSWKEDFVSLHPSPFGHGIYYRSIARLLDAAWKNEKPLGRLRAHALSPPLDPNSYYRGRLESVEKAALDRGWSIVQDWAPPKGDQASTRAGFVHVPMLISETAGAEFSYRFEGTAVGLFVTAGPDAGSVEYSIDGQPFQHQDLFTRWSASLHIPWTYVLDDELSTGAHELVLRVSRQSNPNSKGRTVRIVNLLAN